MCRQVRAFGSHLPGNLCGPPQFGAGRETCQTAAFYSCECSVYPQALAREGEENCALGSLLLEGTTKSERMGSFQVISMEMALSSDSERQVSTTLRSFVGGVSLC
jgi:hypothetical protein